MNHLSGIQCIFGAENNSYHSTLQVKHTDVHAVKPFQNDDFYFRCNNRKGCINYYKDAVGSNGCFFNFLSLTSALCCALDVQPLDESTENEKSENFNYYDHTR